jgi:NRPS condensation-like uncharacterized protein
LVYFHPIADAEAIAMLMKSVMDGYHGHERAPVGAKLDLYPPRHDRFLMCRPRLARKCFWSFPILLKTLRSSWRPRFRDLRDVTNRFKGFSLSEQQSSGLLSFARSLKVTLNDVFLALLLHALSPLAAERKKARRRRNLSVGTVVNIRRDLQIDSRQTFGLFLGSFVVSHEVSDGVDLRTLVREIRTQTEAIKRKQLYLVTRPISLYCELPPRFFPEKAN